MEEVDLEMPSQSDPPRRAGKEQSAMLVPLLFPALLLSGAEGMYSTPIAVVMVVFIGLCTEAVLERKRYTRLYYMVAVAVFLNLYILRREIYLHHGEPDLGWAIFLIRLVVVVALAVGTLDPRPWGLRITTLPLVLLGAVVFFLPGGGDGGAGLSLSPLMKTLILIVLPQVVVPFWEEDNRVRDISSRKRLLVQYASVFAVPWWVGWCIPLLMFLYLSRERKTLPT